MTNEERREAFDKFRDYLRDNGVRVNAMFLDADEETIVFGYPVALERALLRVVASKHNLKVEQKT